MTFLRIIVLCLMCLLWSPFVAIGFVCCLIGHGWNLGFELYKTWFTSLKP